MNAPEVTGLILAGGAGTRMGGKDKGLLCWQGKPLAQHVVERLQPQVNQIFISANRNQTRYAALSPSIKKIISDQTKSPSDAIIPEYAGPLAGILRGLQHCQTAWLQLMPCDVPVFPANLVLQLTSAISAQNHTPSVQILVPEYHQQPQWACALIASTTLPQIEKLFSQGTRKLQSVFSEISYQRVPIHTAITDSTSIQKLYFENFNQPEQLLTKP